MGIFNSILSKLGFGDAPSPAPGATSATPAPSTPAAELPPAAGPTPATPALSVVDIAAQLEARAQAQTEKLNWKVSIVDLLKLLGLDSSLAARKSLATELGCPADKMGDSAAMNIWLHKTVLQKLAAHGGQVPPELLH